MLSAEGFPSTLFSSALCCSAASRSRKIAFQLITFDRFGRLGALMGLLVVFLALKCFGIILKLIMATTSPRPSFKNLCSLMKELHSLWLGKELDPSFDLNASLET